jgi:dienelactone hydrolase
VATAGERSSEPLGPLFLEQPSPTHLHHARTLRFEFSSRGDRVSGRLLLPGAASRPAPLVLLGHGSGGSKEAAYLDAVVGPWLARGAAAAAIDFPLHGERASAKLTAPLASARGVGSVPGTFDAPLVTELAGQAVSDLCRTVATLRGHPALDADRLVYVGFSMGTVLGAPFCAAEPSVRAAVFAVGGAGSGPAAIDPARHVGAFAPRPILFVNAMRDETVPRELAEALHSAAREPKKVLWFDCGHDDLPGDALKAMWEFLEPHLGLG